MSSLNIYETKLNELVEQHNPHLWGDVRRYIESVITQECIYIYKQNGWLEPQGKNYSGVRSQAIQTVLPHLQNNIPQQLRLTDDDICNRASERALYKSLNPKATLREQDPVWQRRQLRKQARRTVATWLYKAGATKNYTTNFSRQLSKDQQKRNDKTLEKRYIITDTGNRMTMKEIADKALTNAHNENIAISRDMITLAKERGWRPHFITLTCAGYRRQYTPDINHKFLQEQWSRMRASLNKKEIVAGVDYMGMRCEEPHKDQTPHRHLVLFCNDETWETIEKAFTDYFLHADTPGERGAKRVRVQFDERENDDWAKAAFYCLKYTFKNASDTTVSDYDESNDTAASCKAWRQDWSIRAFQFFGCGTKTLFRYCRNRNYDMDTGLDIVKAAQEGNWIAFMKEFYRLKADIKTIKIMIQNKYKESVKKVIGYSLANTTLVIKARETIIRYAPAVTLIITEPRGESKAKPLTDFLKKRLNRPPPMPIGAPSP